MTLTRVGETYVGIVDDSSEVTAIDTIGVDLAQADLQGCLRDIENRAQSVQRARRADAYDKLPAQDKAAVDAILAQVIVIPARIVRSDTDVS